MTRSILERSRWRVGITRLLAVSICVAEAAGAASSSEIPPDPHDPEDGRVERLALRWDGWIPHTQGWGVRWSSSGLVIGSNGWVGVAKSTGPTVSLRAKIPIGEPVFSSDMDVAEDILYVVESGTSLRMYDLRADPVRAVGMIEGVIWSVSAVDTLVAVGTDRALQFYSVSRPEAPLLLAELPGSVGMMEWMGSDVLYASRGSWRIDIIDLRDPREPFVVDELTQEGFFPTAIETWAELVAVAWSDVDPWMMTIYDASLPLSPLLLGAREMEGTILDITVSDSVAYVAENAYPDPRFQVYDLRQPVGEWLVAEIPTGVPGASATAVAARDGHLVTGESGSGFATYDVSDPSNPREIGRLNLPGTAISVQKVDEFLVLADGDAGLRVLEDPGARRYRDVDRYGREDGAWWQKVVTGGGWLVADASDTTHIFQLDRSGQLQRYGFYDVASFDPVAVEERVMVGVTEFGWRLAIVDISSPETPVEVDRVDLAGDLSVTFAAWTAGDSTLFAGGGGSALYVWSYVEGRGLKELTRMWLLGSIRNVTRRDDLIVAQSQGGLLQTIHWDEPSHTLELIDEQRVHRWEVAGGLLIEGNLVYAGGTDSLSAISLSEDGHLGRRIGFKTAGSPYSLAPGLRPGEVAFTMGSGGLGTLRHYYGGGEGAVAPESSGRRAR